MPADIVDQSDDSDNELVHFTLPHNQKRVPIPRSVLEAHPDTYFAKAAQRQVEGDLARSTELKETGYGYEYHVEDIFQSLQDSKQVANLLMSINTPLEKSKNLHAAMDYYQVPTPVSREELEWNWKIRQEFQRLKNNYEQPIKERAESVAKRYRTAFLKHVKQTTHLSKIKKNSFCMMILPDDLGHAYNGNEHNFIPITVDREEYNMMSLDSDNGRRKFFEELISRLERLLPGVDWLLKMASIQIGTHSEDTAFICPQFHLSNWKIN